MPGPEVFEPKSSDQSTAEVRGIAAALRQLALDLRWTWCHEADTLWMRVDGKTWAATQNPLSALQSLSDERLKELASDKTFVAELDALSRARQDYRNRETWYSTAFPISKLAGAAFFSMEFALGEALPLYAGGLGVLAGDILKTASDLGVPLVGVGLLYQSGYFRQKIDAMGGQIESYPYYDPASLPIKPASATDGTPLLVQLELPGRALVLRVWQALVGRTTLYLLDSNDPANSVSDRGITARLYDGATETRLQQELVLGVGGLRALRALKPEIEVCHLNEGHAAFLILERAVRFMRRNGSSFAQAIWATRGGNIFTSHTPVAAGFDRFPVKLLQPYLAALYDGTADLAQFLAMGREQRGRPDSLFNMTHLALRGSLRTFAVSRRHGEVSRRLFQTLFPNWPAVEIPVDYVTNGVHVPSWDSVDADALWTVACGKERWRAGADGLSSAIEALSDEAVWTLRGNSRSSLISQVRVRLRRQLAERGFGEAQLTAADQVFDPNILTLGFARRFTDYKRLDQLLTDPERLSRILNHPTNPVQLVLAGKAHPNDRRGREMLHSWIALAQRPEFRRRLVFLEDYDLMLAQDLIQGVDVWINTPRRPWEACGTSGMKVLANGGLNLSELDGWWEEAFTPEVGWAIGSTVGRQDPDVDHKEADELYAVIETAIVPEFYARDASGMPTAWIKRIRKSMATLTIAYSSNRVVKEYLERGYLFANAEFSRRSAQNCEMANGLCEWATRLGRGWATLHIGETGFALEAGERSFSVPIYFGEVDQSDVVVELYADGADGAKPEILKMTRGSPVAGATNGNLYTARTTSARPATDYTVRIVPAREGAGIPTELPLIAWQR
jgi:starch phosphorylase